jgi:serine/threonine protein kinase
MDPDDCSQPTQATQNVLDPRRVGQQNSGFSDEDISDIICILVPYSDAARQELKRIADEKSHHMVTRDDVDKIDMDYETEDNAENFTLVQQDIGEHHIALRFSANVKNSLAGFTFGRNPTRCDICLMDDPHRRLSNIHFRIYLNEHAVLMLEDQSTNGTIVDDILLKSKANPPVATKRTLVSGSKIKILMHQDANDLTFLVRVPKLEGRHLAAYKRNLYEYMGRQTGIATNVNETIVPGPGGHVDIFKAPVRKPPLTTWAVAQRTKPAAETRAGAGALLDQFPGVTVWSGSRKYNRVGEIGKGAFATVYKVTSKFNGLPYAAKELDKTKFMRNGVLDQKVENEMNIMARIKHPNIVEYVEHLDWDERIMIIIMEFIPGGDLGKMIHELGPLPEFDTQIISKQLLDALGYLHKMNITHRDVKPDNILVASQEPLVVKLTDFGLSKAIDNDETFLRTFCGTLLYCAPEVYDDYPQYDDNGRRHFHKGRYRRPPGQRYNHAVDIWSLGGVLFYAMTKRPPFPAKNGASHNELLHRIMTRQLDTSPLSQKGVSHTAIDFLSRMLDRRPETRATVDVLQAHPWVRATTLAESFDEVSDEELRIEASQLSLADDERERTAEREQTVELVDDVIPDSDDEIIDDSQENDENRFNGYESEKENYTFGPGDVVAPPARGNQHRLFGEVNASAMGSSGVIPAERLNLPVSVTSSASTELLGVTEIRDSFDSSEDSSTPRQASQKPPAHNASDLRASVLMASQSRSVDELNNLTFNIESQSLGGTESFLEHLNVKSRAGSLLRKNELNTSKRKQSPDSSGEVEPQPTRDRRVLKRLRSEGSVESLSPSIDETDVELLAHIPSIGRLQSSRQIDYPVHKSAFWVAQDKKTWHLEYPEMTQLQLDAFKAAATSRNEEFRPGKSPLWDLALKYFPPTHRQEVTGERQPQPSEPIPSTAMRDDFDFDEELPNTQDPEARAAVPADLTPLDKQVVASLKSSPGSVLPNVSIYVTESMASWGRASDNTRLYLPRTEARVPKYGFKILLWGENFDPCKTPRPWNRPQEVDERSVHFYIATKASSGISVNGKHLPSMNHMVPGSPCEYWMRLHHNDTVVVWQTSDSTARTELIFRCNWGGSATARPTGMQPPYVATSIADRLDELLPRTEKKIRNLIDHDTKLDKANRDVDLRMTTVDRERERSRAFELIRQEACRALALKRNSPQPYSAHTESNATVQATWLSHMPNRAAATTLRTASPTISDLLRGARR